MISHSVTPPIFVDVRAETAIGTVSNLITDRNHNGNSESVNVAVVGSAIQVSQTMFGKFSVRT